MPGRSNHVLSALLLIPAACGPSGPAEIAAPRMDVVSNEQEVCHRTRAGSFIAIPVSGTALSVHLSHGDFLEGAEASCDPPDVIAVRINDVHDIAAPPIHTVPVLRQLRAWAVCTMPDLSVIDCTDGVFFESSTDAVYISNELSSKGYLTGQEPGVTLVGARPIAGSTVIPVEVTVTDCGFSLLDVRIVDGHPGAIDPGASTRVAAWISYDTPCVVPPGDPHYVNNADVTWTSTDPSVASVSGDGTVTAAVNPSPAPPIDVDIRGTLDGGLNDGVTITILDPNH